MPKETEYVKMTQLEHIMARPDMYIGSQERVNENMWVFDESVEQMVQRKLTWTPGLYKIFDEIIVNAADNKVRAPEQNAIKIDIDEEQGKVRVWNNGQGIPVQVHKEHKIWIPEMIFGHLLTSSNYNDKENRVTGGRNGFGAKLTNVFSKKFKVKTFHRRSGKKFEMTWKDNMSKPGEPVITPVGREEGGDDYTEVTFWPDFNRFKMDTGFDDVVHLMKRRAYDLAGSTAKDVRVYLNGKKLEIKNFQDYVDLYPTMGEEKKSAAYAKVGERWEICIRPSNIGFQQMSFVNSIATTKGGKHVEYIAGQVVDKVIETIKGKKGKGKKSDLDPKPHMIRPFLWVFINCQIENPSFDSQTKETLDTTKPKFGSTCDLPKSMIDYLLKSGIVERTLETANSKLTKMMAGKVKGSGAVRVTGIPKLDDANEAGTKNSASCTLILTEGDSAKTLAVSGLGTVGRDYFGVFPLRGKPLNVRDASMKKVLDCEEIQHIMKIVGLKVGKTYTDTSELRYGQIMIMADQDHDGSHIKGLIINMIHHFWPSLFKLPGFLTQFITPIVKAKPNKNSGGLTPLSFFSLPDFLEWRKRTPDSEQKKYTVKYYKGLGTSSPEEGREYFSDIKRHRIKFHRDDDADEKRIIMAFGKDNVEDRKKWITDFNPQSSETVDFKKKDMRFSEFIDKELILFSVADCERSIPSIVDGLKPGQRKILFGCFKRNLTKIIKVAQLQGYVSEHAAYHHGDASLNQTIVALAQDFVGSNNLPLLVNDGQFGTRLAGGKDAASARYIFTNLQKLSRIIFHPMDDFVLDYKDDDGFPVEPHHYLPVIPMTLINGTSGIGTGFATSIPNFNPMDVLSNIRRLIKGEDVMPMTPWYYGFRGAIEQKAPGKFLSRGICKVHDDGIVTISELPVGTWTNAYKKMLEGMVEKELVLNFREFHTDITVDFDISLHPSVLRQYLEQGVLEEKLDLSSYIHASNIIGFDRDGKLAKFADAEAVLKEFYFVRLDGYVKRKQYMLKELQRTIGKLSNMLRFVNEVMDGTLIVARKKKADLLKEIKSRGYVAYPPQQKKKQSETTTEQSAEDNSGDTGAAESDDPLAMFNVNLDDIETPEVATATKDYDYLLGMKLWSLTQEMVERLKKQKNQAESDYKKLQEKSEATIWLEDLDEVEKAVTKYYQIRDKHNSDVLKKRRAQNRLRMPTRTPMLGDKAKKELQKEADAFAKKAKTAAKSAAKLAGGATPAGGAEGAGLGLGLGGGDEGDASPGLLGALGLGGSTTTAAAPRPKPKPKPKRKKKKKDSDDEESDWDTTTEEPDSTDDSDDDSDDSGSDDSSSSSDDADDEEDSVPKKKERAAAPKKTSQSKKATTSSQEKEKKPRAPRKKASTAAAPATATSAAINLDIDDDFLDFGNYGSSALGGGGGGTATTTTSGGGAAAAKKTAAPTYNILDDEDEALLGLTGAVTTTKKASPAQSKVKKAPTPKTSSASKKKVVTKRSKRGRGNSDDDDSEDDDDSDESSAYSSSSGSGSDDSDDDDSSSDDDWDDSDSS